MSAASSAVLEPMEKRVLFSGFPITAWNFDNLTAGTNLAPAASTGTGTSSSVGMQSTGTVGVAPYPTPNAPGPDASAVTSASGSSDGTSNTWKIVGTNGWNSSTAIASQGAQFLTSTSNYTGVNLKFDWLPSAQGEQKLAVEYTIDNGGHWANALTSSNATVPTGLTLVNNTSSANSISGYYINYTTLSSPVFVNGITVDLSGIAGAQNASSGFGIRLVNAATLSDDTAVKTGGALNNTSGNWSFDEVQILGTPINATKPSITATGNPANLETNGGAPATFTAAAIGAPTPAVQWQTSTGAAFVNVTTGTGGTTNSYTITATPALSGSSYRAVFTNSAGNAVTTAATLTVPSVPTVTLQPTNQTVAVSNPVTFTAAGYGPTTTSVVWRVSTDGGVTFPGSSNITTGTYNTTTGGAATLTFTPLLGDTGKQYEAFFTSGGAVANSSAASLTVLGTPITAWTSLAGSTSVSPPAPYPNVGVGTLYPLDMANDYSRGYLSVTMDDVTATKGTLNSNFTENVLRVRGGNGVTGGAPSNGWTGFAPNEDQGLQFNVSTAGYTNPALTFDWYCTTSGMRQAQIQYTTDGGSTWHNTGSVLTGNSNDYYGATAGGAPSGVFVNLQSIPGAADNANFAVRMVSEYQQSTDSSNPATYLPQIFDGNQLITNSSTGLPTAHGQFATAAAGGAYQEQEIAISGQSDSGSFEITVPGVGTTGPISYDSGYTAGGIYSNMATNITNALTALKSGLLVSASNDPVAALDGIARNFLIQFAAPQTGPITITNNTISGTNDPASNSSAGVPLTPGVTVIYSGNATGSLIPYTDDLTTGGNWRFGNIVFTGTSKTGAPSILSQSVGGTAVLNSSTGTVNFNQSASVYAEQGIGSVQWQESKDGGSSWVNVGPATLTNNSAGTVYSSTLSETFTTSDVNAQPPYEFQATFYGKISGNAQTSTGTVLVVQPIAPTFTLPTGAGVTPISSGQPTSVSVVGGTVATLTSTAVGLPFTTTAANWQISNGGIWTNLPAADISTTVSTLSTGYQQSTSVLSYPTTADQSGTQLPIEVIFSNTVSSLTSNTVYINVLHNAAAVTQWDFGNLQSNTSTGLMNAPDNTPTPNINIAPGMLNAIGFTDPNFPSVPAADVTNTPGGANTAFTANTWRLRGGAPGSLSNTGANGWDTLAPQYSQGAEIDVNTTGKYGVYLHFDWYTTAQGVRDLQEEYCLNINAASPVWQTINPVLVAPNGGDFYGATKTAAPTGATLDLTGISGADNNPNLGIRLVSAYDPALPTITDSASVQSQEQANGPAWVLPEPHGQYASTTLVNGAPVPINGTSGNWRFGTISLFALNYPAWLSPSAITSGAAVWNTNTQVLNVTGSATIIGDPALSGDSPLINVSASGNLLVDSEAIRSVHIGGLNVSGSGIVTVSPTTTTDILVVAQGGAFNLASGTTFDLKNNFLDLQASNVTAGGTIVSNLDTLLNNQQLFSSTANSDSTHLTELGVMDNNGAYNGAAGSLGTFAGTMPGTYDVLMRYTYFGDANLDGRVDGSDYSLVDNAALSGLAGAPGAVDFNHDGLIDGSDYTLIDNAFNTQGPRITPAAQIANPAALFANAVPITSVPSISDLQKKDKAGVLTSQPDVVDSLDAIAG